VHGDVVAIGPLMWVLLGLGVLSWLLALFVTIDGLRRRLTGHDRLPETLWPYIALCGAYAVAYTAFQFPQITARVTWAGSVVVYGLPLVMIAGVAYLLRVVFPKRTAAVEASAAETAAETAGTEPGGPDLPEDSGATRE
jgi:hypothetical protein